MTLLASNLHRQGGVFSAFRLANLLPHVLVNATLLNGPLQGEHGQSGMGCDYASVCRSQVLVR